MSSVRQILGEKIVKSWICNPSVNLEKSINELTIEELKTISFDLISIKYRPDEQMPGDYAHVVALRVLCDLEIGYIENQDKENRVEKCNACFNAPLIYQSL